MNFVPHHGPSAAKSPPHRPSKEGQTRGNSPDKTREEDARIEPVVVDDTAALLALLSALRFARQIGEPSAWSYEDWLFLTRALDPRERIVVVMHAIRGMGFEEIADWFGFSRPRADQLWRRALEKIRNDEFALATVA